MPKAPDRSKNVQEPFLLATVFITGASVLALEIFGTRIIAPFYGSTIYVWSSLIVVTLLALSLGYLAGGIWADQERGPQWLWALVAGAGVSIALIPLIRHHVMAATQSLGVALGALVSAVVLFGLPLALLGSVGPQVIRRISGDLIHVGRSSGYVYAVSTLGSVAGALLSGFWLISVAPMKVLVLGLAAVLIFWSALGFWRSKRAMAATAVGFVAIGVLAVVLKPVPVAATNVLMNQESPYGQVKVLEQNHIRYLLIDGVSHSSWDTQTGESAHSYVDLLEVLPFMVKNPKRAMVIGLGGGDLVKLFERRYSMVVDSAEIDPVVVRAAREFFDFDQHQGEIRLWDGRRYVKSRPDHFYDFVMMDAFGADRQPPHLATQEFFSEVKSRLKPGGVLVLNTIGFAQGPAPLPWENLYRTLKESFKEIRVIAIGETGDDLANVILFAGDEPLEPRWAAFAQSDRVRQFWGEAIKREIKPDLARLQKARRYHDDWSVFDIDSSWAMLKFRSKIVKSRAHVLLF